MATCRDSKTRRTSLQLCARLGRNKHMDNEILTTILTGLNVIQRLINKLKGESK